MQLKVIRHTFLPDCVHGRLFIDNVFFAHTLEDKVRDFGANGEGKVQNETAIPNGTYHVIASMSPHFGRVTPEILHVPYFAGIRIHGGNTKADTEGCILIGEQSDNNGKIWNCATKVNELVAKLTGVQGATIEIINQPAQAV